jgi:hypothetical protein
MLLHGPCGIDDHFEVVERGVKLNLLLRQLAPISRASLPGWCDRTWPIANSSLKKQRPIRDGDVEVDGDGCVCLFGSEKPEVARQGPHFPIYCTSHLSHAASHFLF